MEQLQKLIEQYQEHPSVRQLTNTLQDTRHIHLTHVHGSAASFITAASFNLLNKPMLLVLPDREEAAYYFNDLENLLGNGKVLFFPASYRKPFKLNGHDTSAIQMRAEVLSYINKHSDRFMVVSYAEAVAENVVTKNVLEKSTIEARVGESLSIDFVNDFLTENNFQRTDFVFEPGQFAIRGGIVDVYSFAYELPYRLEFDGNNIQSIRSFDPITQLSDKNLQFVTVIPNIQTELKNNNTESFFSFLPESTLIATRDLGYQLQYLKENIEAVFEREVPADEIQDYDDAKKVYPSDTIISGYFRKHTNIEFGVKSNYENALEIPFHIKPQPQFNKNFNLLSENLKANSDNKIQSFIFSESAKQIERIYAIFEDMNAKQKNSDEEIQFKPVYTSIFKGFIDDDLKIAFYTDHQIFDRYHRFKLRKNYSRNEAISIKELYSLKPGDYVTHIDYGVGRFGGLEKLNIEGKQQETIRLVYKDNDILYVSIHSLHRIARYTGKDGAAPSLNKLGSTAWATLKQKTKKKVKDIARDLIALYAKRKAQEGFAYSKDNYLQTELEASFIYEDTPDQVKATRDVKKDMEKTSPMDRLICGDVGFGKTEIAIRAAFKAVSDNKQVALLVPTTILAMQHYRTFLERLKEFPCNIDYINRFKTSAQQTETIKKIEEGKVDIIIGTHRLLSKDIKFKNLGLLIIDEEQKFGVASKDKIKSLKVNVDTLTLTATPIPRTLQFSLMGARDLSVINTPPPNRYPVTTELHTFNDKIIRDAIMYEVSRGGQVFFVHNRVMDIHDIADMIRKLCPDVKVSVGHGQMDGSQLEEVLMTFIEGDSDVLVATTIIESGIDISNANTIIINQAQNFGLSDLHQMRGRVGRSNKKAFCYLLAPPLTVLTPEARQRLRAIEEYSDLGMGFQVALRDLDIRGAGNLLGGEQSGFISEIGLEMYQKILDEALIELRETDFKGLFPDDDNKPIVSDCQVETDLEILIPTNYVENIVERLNLYKELDDIENEENLIAFASRLRDRFGPVPKQVKELMETVRLRWKARKMGFEKLILKNGQLKGYLVSNPDSKLYKSELFMQIINFVKNNPSRCRMKEVNDKLSITFYKINTVEEGNKLFEQMTAHAAANA
ncbi:MAG: transcription-repair coupling factor [Bacteroidetes bacterium]|jgi:transcription-repair coupling factor (superfamily II helicase)|nr:transcription-repair coupling factor [Bacteroidota bacterium]